jgi:hypothetical protein
MTVSYRIEPELKLIRTRCIGDTTLHDVQAHFAELRAHPDLPQPLDVLLDFTELTNLPRLDQLETAAGSTASLTPRLRWGVMAIVVRDEQAFQISRVYEALISHYFEGVRLFHSADEAESWVAEARAARTVEPGPA